MKNGMDEVKEHIELGAVYDIVFGQFCACSDETEVALNRIVEEVRALPNADVVEVVRCKDCIYWQKPQVKLHDGTYRDYEPGEYENGSILGGVELSVGINVGSFCAKYDKWHGNKIPQFMGENDFCSKGDKRAECTK